MSEYLPLARLIEQGLKEGTVLERDDEVIHHWIGNRVVHDGESNWERNPFHYLWRIVSTPPKKITFETVFRGLTLAMPDEHGFNIGDAVIVTVEEKRCPPPN